VNFEITKFTCIHKIFCLICYLFLVLKLGVVHVSDEEQTPTNTGDEDKEAEDVHNTVTKSQDIIGISKTHGISHLSQAASIVIGGNCTG
jgi:hypothetical protein